MSRACHDASGEELGTGVQRASGVCRSAVSSTGMGIRQLGYRPRLLDGGIGVTALTAILVLARRLAYGRALCLASTP